LAEKGGHVAVHFYQNEDAAESTLAKMRECGSDGFLVQADACHPEEISRIFKRVETEFCSLDIFVSNARMEAPTFYQSPMEITLEKWDTAVDSQAKAFLVGVREAARLMRAGGRIIARAENNASLWMVRCVLLCGIVQTNKPLAHNPMQY
jgi:NAD(P)-dependent dehydrogenase (short-subunit alcohol dehydrogenase family)